MAPFAVATTCAYSVVVLGVVCFGAAACARVGVVLRAGVCILVGVRLGAGVCILVGVGLRAIVVVKGRCVGSVVLRVDDQQLGSALARAAGPACKHNGTDDGDH